MFAIKTKKNPRAYHLSSECRLTFISESQIYRIIVVVLIDFVIINILLPTIANIHHSNQQIRATKMGKEIRTKPRHVARVE